MNIKGCGNGMVDIVMDKNFFDEDKVFLIPTFNENKPIKVYFENEYNIEETEEELCVTKKISIEEAIKKVKAAGNDPYEFIDTLLKDGRWEGMII